MQHITRSEAQQALDELEDGSTKFSIQGEPDRLGGLTVYNVRVWDGEDVDWRDVMFTRTEGKVLIYSSLN